jgi:hypothetical protein
MSTRNLPGGKERPERTAVNLTASCKQIVWKVLGALTSHKFMFLHCLLQGLLEFDGNYSMGRYTVPNRCLVTIARLDTQTD